VPAKGKDREVARAYPRVSAINKQLGQIPSAGASTKPRAPHSCASLLLARGVQPKVVAELLGHASVQITLALYGHVSPSMARDAGAELSASILGGRRENQGDKTMTSGAPSLRTPRQSVPLTRGDTRAREEDRTPIA